jgi:hypothetical protein
VPVHVLKADALAAAWPRLDRFEGPGYRRTRYHRSCGSHLLSFERDSWDPARDQK